MNIPSTPKIRSMVRTEKSKGKIGVNPFQEGEHEAKIPRKSPLLLDRYAKPNGNIVLARSQKPEPRSWNLEVELKAAGILAPGFRLPYPAAFWRDIKGAALG